MAMATIFIDFLDFIILIRCPFLPLGVDLEVWYQREKYSISNFTMSHWRKEIDRYNIYRRNTTQYQYGVVSKNMIFCQTVQYSEYGSFSLLILHPRHFVSMGKIYFAQFCIIWFCRQFHIYCPIWTILTSSD